MAGKRTATSDLNHDNWDDEGEPEEAGTFKRAPEDVLKQRVIKTARRRKPMGSEVSSKLLIYFNIYNIMFVLLKEESATKNVFSGFSGFGKTTTQPAAANSPFAFLNSMTNNTSTNQNGSSLFSSTSDTNKPTLTFTPTKTEEKPKENGTSKTEKKNDESKNTEYYASLKGLNESVANWIKTHVDENPFCILTPIFKDYEKYLLEIESKKDKTDNSGIKNINIGSSTTQSTSITFGSSNTSSVGQDKPILFGLNTSKSPEKTNALKPTESTIFG